MLDEWHVDQLIVKKLDDPLLTVDVDECFWLGPTETAASGQQLALEVVDRLPGADLMDDFAQVLRLRQPRQRALGAREVIVSRRRHTECTETVVARVEQIFHDGQACRLVNVSVAVKEVVA